MSTESQIVRIEYRQTLAVQSDSPGWSEDYEVTFAFTSQALTSGWLAEFAGRHGGDLAVFTALGLHARPLKGEALQRLTDLGQTTKADEGRLFTEVSDMALAAELKVRRQTIQQATDRLAQQGLVRILDLRPTTADGVRRPLMDADGHFLKTKLYIITGELQMFFKQVKPLDISEPESDRVRKAHTVDDSTHVRKANTVENDDRERKAHMENLPNTVNGFRTDPVRNPCTNIKTLEEEEEGITSSNLTDPILLRFVELKGRPHEFSPKEFQELAKLRAAGYAETTLLQVMESAFQAEPLKRPRHFTLVARIVRQTQTLNSWSASTGITVPPHPEDAPVNRTSTGPQAIQLPVQQTDSDWAEAEALLQAFPEAAKAPTRSQLLALAKSCDSVAQEHGATGQAWVTRALRFSLQADNPARYLAATLDEWIAHGPPDKRSRERSTQSVAPAREIRWDDSIDA